MSPGGRLLGGLLHGTAEPVLRRLPETVRHSLQHPDSESSLLWNLIYPRALPSLRLGALTTLRPLWGSTPTSDEADSLVPYFWGHDLAGERLDGLDSVLEALDGPGKKTEVDLFLLGRENLITVEAKQGASFGRCGRYAAGRCPEVHGPGAVGERTCRYWEGDGSRFDRLVAMGSRPKQDHGVLPCDRHYQLARTFLAGAALADRLGVRHHLWVFVPRRTWAGLEPVWLDFTERVRSDSAWRRLRAVSWEALETLPVR